MTDESQQPVSNAHQEQISPKLLDLWKLVFLPWSRVAGIIAVGSAAIVIYTNVDAINNYIRGVTAPQIHQFAFNFDTFIEKRHLPGDNWMTGFFRTGGRAPALLTISSIDEPNDGPHADEVLVENVQMNNEWGILVSIGFSGGIDKIAGSVKFNIYQPDAKEWPAPIPCPYGHVKQQC
jgi:hypothetical protein